MKTTIFLILIFMPFILQAQTSFFREATIINAEGESLNSFVKFTSESSLSKEIIYKEHLDDKAEMKIFPGELQEVCFTSDSICYERVEYSYEEGDIKRSEIRLAKKMVTGYTNLYKLQLPPSEYKTVYEKDNTYVYILKIYDEYYVLKQVEGEYLFKESPSDHGKLVYKLDKRYRGVLAYLFRDEPSLRRKIETLPFTDGAFQEIVVSYNERKTVVKSVVHSNKVKTLVTHSLELGYIAVQNSPEISGYGYNFGYIVNILNPDISGKISTNLGIAYSYYYWHSDFYSYEKGYIRFPFQANFKFSKSNFIPYFDIGLTPTVSGSSADIFFNTGIGCTLYKRFNFSMHLESESLNFDQAILLFFSIGFNLNSKQY